MVLTFELLEACRYDVPKFAAGGERVLALFDNDRVRHPLMLENAACKRQVLDAIFKSAEQAASPRVVLLDRNLESVLTVVHECLGAESNAQLFEEAVKSKRHNARDRLCQRAANAALSVRVCILEKSPSFKRAVDEAVGALR